MYVHQNIQRMSKKQQITDVIRNDLLREVYPKGTALPGELAFADAYGVSRHTVRAALEQLKKEGLLYTRHGVGSFMRDGCEEPQYTQSFTSTDDLLMHTGDTAFQIVSCQEQVLRLSDENLKIGLRRGEKWLAVTVERSSKTSQRPISRATVYARPVYFAEVAQFAQGQHPLFKLIERKNGPTLEIEQHIAARAASPAESAYFSIRKHRPILEITRVYYGQDRTPYEITVTAYNAETFRYVSTIQPTASKTMQGDIHG
ncbi:MAG: GntR family transcriptional regulator [Burkholderiaceae bacterium]|nr:GntR family transcriptional regulator [Burkholderiaceae bacterium]